MLDPDALVASRYRVLGPARHGGQAAVYPAEDVLLGHRVALKFVRGRDDEDWARYHRERRALQLLRLPGVVELLDHGELHGTRYLVLSWVEGAPFPGSTAPMAFEDVRSRLRSLLEVLGRVHDAGVVHRDLKPGNVLVDERGRCTLVDFGLARGPLLGGALTEPGEVLGTADYLAPEQLLLEAEPTPVSDVFAIGILVWRALRPGAHPWPAGNLRARVDALLRGHPPRWSALEPIPEDLRAFLEAVLQIEPRDRPESARDALELLGAGVEAFWIPWLGGEALPAAATSRLVRGESVDVAARPGLGRTRLLREIELRLAGSGRRCHWLSEGQRALESLGGLLSASVIEEAASEDAPLQRALEHIEARLSGDMVIVSDAPERLDPATALLVSRLRERRPVLRILGEHEPAGLRLEALGEEDLRPLFRGPERLLHRQSRGARLLFRRTLGDPKSVVAELGAWQRAGLATMEDGQVATDDTTLDRMELDRDRPAHVSVRAAGALPSSEISLNLLAWTSLLEGDADAALLSRATELPEWLVRIELGVLRELGLIEMDGADGSVRDLSGGAAFGRWPTECLQAASARLPALLPGGSPALLRHLVAAGQTHQAAREARLLGERRARGGQIAEALAVLELALRLSRESDDPATERDALRALALTALASESGPPLRRASFEIRRASSRWEELAVLVEGSALALEDRSSEEALRTLSALSPFDDEDLEGWRRSSMAQAAYRVDLEIHERIVEDTYAWSRGRGALTVSKGSALLAHLRYRQEALEEAISHHRDALAFRPQVDGRIASALGFASTLLDAGRYDEAHEIAERAREQSEALRHRVYEARAEWLLRRVSYQMGRADRVDHELLAASRELSLPYLDGLIWLTEATVAWRIGSVEARPLARRSLELLKGLGAGRADLLAAALVSDLEADATIASDVLAVALGPAVPGVAVQAIALVAPLLPPLSPEVRRRVEILAEGLRSPDLRREVMSVHEALGRLGLR